MSLKVCVVCAVILAALALPAGAHASIDLAISQVPSARVVDAGSPVTFKVTVSNQGTEAYEGGVYVNLFSLRGHGQGANNPYKSFSSSQGSCRDNTGEAYGYTYHNLICELGALATGASAQITAVVEVNESMNHFASLLPNAYEGGYQDADDSDNEAVDRVTASTPPIVSGSKKIKLKGLPAGCAPNDFTLRAVAMAKGVKKMAASLFLGFDEEGEGQELRKVRRGNRLTIKVPVSRLEPELGAVYKLKVKAKRGALGPLKATVAFQRC